ncbi:MAG: autotransporter-associated beta strand repeat-containing protein [Verrucomicrobia bacterium]|nr:autotransporter-associated beta strand repeat-containing protein [Verrucomicrobiota bacterium]
MSGNNTVTFQAGDSYTGGYSIYNGLDVGQNFRANPGSGVLNVTGGTLHTGSLLVGHVYGGTINVSGGAMIIDGGTMLFGWGASSSLNVSGNGTVTMAGTLDPGNPYFNFGHSAQSFLNISSNGTVNVQRAVSVQAGSVVDVNGANSTLNFSGAANLNLVAGSKISAENGGSINMSGGQVTINGTEGLWLGGAGTTGTLNLSGGTWTQTGMFRLGVFASGNGIVNQTGGVFELGNNIEVWGSSVSQYNLAGGTFRLLGNYAINNYTTGSTFNITGASGNVTVDAGAYNFTLLNTSTFNNANATLTKTGAGTLTFSGASQLQIANGALDMQAGTIETASSLAIGISGSSATGTMSGGTLKTGYLAASNFIVGYGQTGTFTQSNGTVDIGSQASAVFGWSGGTGNYTLSGGTFSAANNTYLGLGGAGTLNVNGGSYTAFNMWVGGNGGTGTLNLNGGTLNVTNSMTVGAGGTLGFNSGTLNLAGSLASPDFTIGSGGTLNLNSGGSLANGLNLTVNNGALVKFNGGTGNATMNLLLSGGTVDVNGQSLGAGTWANLCATTSGAVLKNSSGNATIAAGNNTIWIWDAATNLTINATGNLQIDSRITSSGQPNPTGIIKTGNGALVLNSNLNDYTGATLVNAGILQVNVANGLGSTSNGTTVASGAQLRLNGVTVGAEALTISGNGTTAGSAGALRAGTGSNTYQGKVTLAADAKIFAGSGTSMTLDVASGDAVNLANFTLTVDGAGSHTVSDGITGTGGVTKIGSGTTTLSAVNSYTGATTVNVGTLLINGSTSASSAVTVASGATLGGSGTVGGFTTVSGNLKPGNSPGTLSFSSGLTLASTSNTTMEITGIGAGLFDRVVVTGQLDFGGTLSLNNTGYTAVYGNSVDLFDWTTTTGSFSAITGTDLGGGYSWDTSNLYSTGVITVVPEPATWALLAFSLTTVVVLRRRRWNS